MVVEQLNWLSDSFDAIDYQVEVSRKVRKFYQRKLDNAISEYIATSMVRTCVIDEVFEDVVEDGYAFRVRVTIGELVYGDVRKCSCILSDFTWK